MANLLRRRERDANAPARAWESFPNDPFQMMRDMLRWDPFREMESVGGWPGRAFVPDVELKETPEAYVFKADLPGVQEKDLDVSVTGNRIHITGKREEEEQKEDERYYAYERSYGTFTRSFTLPEGANAEEVKAELKDGVLQLEVPKKPEVQPRRIAIGGVSEKKTLEASGEKQTSSEQRTQQRGAAE